MENEQKELTKDEQRALDKLDMWVKNVIADSKENGQYADYLYDSAKLDMTLEEYLIKGKHL